MNEQKTALVVRLGAYGDMLIISPLLRYLKEQGYYTILNTSRRGKEIYDHSSLVDEIVFYRDNQVADDELQGYWDSLKEKIKPDYYVNLCESIEVNLAIHPRDEERYNQSKEDRIKQCNRNYYEETMRIAGVECDDYRPTIQFTKSQRKEARQYIDKSKFNVLFGLMGSGHNKFYPWNIPIINELSKYNNINVITVGDPRCKLVEDGCNKIETPLSGKIPMMTSLALTMYADLVVAPDTGLLHASGCFSTPKIGLLGHTTKENITKHFVNDHSIEAEVYCAPCMRLIYDYTEQCPIDPATGAAMCMGSGIHPAHVIDKIMTIYRQWTLKRKAA